MHEITKREILFSVTIVFVMLAFGFGISSMIRGANNRELETYYKSMKIDNDAEAFEYAMDTNVGTAMVYGEFEINDPVTVEELIGEYGYIRIEYERYEEHINTVYEYDDKGNITGSHIEITYSWDFFDSDEWKSKEVNFLNKTFPTSLIPLPASHTLYLTEETINTTHQYSNNWIYKSGSPWNHRVGQIRYKYIVVPTLWNGTIMANLGNGTIQPLENERAVRMWTKDINEVVESQEASAEAAPIVFWVFWLVLTGGAVWAFVYSENEWLEEIKKGSR